MIDALAILPLDGLSATTRLRLSSLSAGPDAMEAGVVFARCTIPPDALSMAHAPVAGPRGRSGRDGIGVVCLCLGSSGWSALAAMMPILRKSVGGHRPQFPVKESMQFRRSASLSVLATLADEGAERRDDDMNHLCLFEVVRIGHNFALESQLKSGRRGTKGPSMQFDTANV